MSGALALVGSGEYTMAMAAVDRALLDTLGGPDQARVVVLPTASGLEPGMPETWNARGVAHFAALGASVMAVPLLTRDDAHAQPILDALSQANFFYLSGGNPKYAVTTWQGTPAWQILCDRYQAGAVVAGCSAGAMMLGGHTISVRAMAAGQAPVWEAALGLIPGVVTLPHFDRIHRFVDDDQLRSLLASAPAAAAVAGIDEDTALVRFTDRWQVMGRQTATIFEAGKATRYVTGVTVPLPLPDDGAHER